MEYLSWDLSILSRAVAYANLSSASAHVGLSQPQLSRIVAKLESELDVVLLDRETRRKSSWTPTAYRLAEIYARAFHNFRAEVASLTQGLDPDHFRVGTLEGLIPQALAFCHALLSSTKVMVVELDVLDQNFLEEKFTKNEVDVIFSMREPGRKKFRYVKVLGYQTIEPVEKGEPRVYSMFEYASTLQKGKPKAKTFVSNSLRVRQEWFEQFGGSGSLPSDMRAKKTGKKTEVPVLVIAHDALPPRVWGEIETLLDASD
jgi:hypothetical protein